jgi:hypothetical protein
LGTIFPNIVLVHGIWADGSSWNKVIPILQNAGHKIIAVQLPLNSLADDVATARKDERGLVIKLRHSILYLNLIGS